MEFLQVMKMYQLNQFCKNFPPDFLQKLHERGQLFEFIRQFLGTKDDTCVDVKVGEKVKEEKTDEVKSVKFVYKIIAEMLYKNKAFDEKHAVLSRKKQTLVAAWLLNTTTRRKNFLLM